MPSISTASICIKRESAGQRVKYLELQAITGDVKVPATCRFLNKTLWLFTSASLTGTRYALRE